MSDTSAFGFGKFVPGFDFLQNLSQTASKAAPAAGGVPGMGSWVAPTLSVEEIDKRIQELKAVQFWLEQNGTALKATIQALEVQKMTLTTLQGMNVSMADLAKAFTAKPPESAAPAAPPPQPQPASQPVQAAPTPTPTPAPPPEPEVDDEETQQAASGQAKAQAKGEPKPGADKPAVDPMAWWGSLTQQFQNIASTAMKDVAAEAMKAQSAAKAASAASAAKAKNNTKGKAKDNAKVKSAAQPASTSRDTTANKAPAKTRSAVRKTPAKKVAGKASGQTVRKSATTKRPAA